MLSKHHNHTLHTNLREEEPQENKSQNTRKILEWSKQLSLSLSLSLSLFLSTKMIATLELPN